jgi:hypothetical protein
MKKWALTFNTMATVAQLTNEAERLKKELKERAQYYSAHQLRALRKRKNRLLSAVRKVKDYIKAKAKQ